LNNEKIGNLGYKHGGRHTRLYNIWTKMLQRCKNVNDVRYKDYGGRGIVVCEEWKDFAVFRDWALLNGYLETLTIERKNVNGNYEPNNCTWIPKGKQSENKRTTHYLTYNGKTKSVKQWADIFNIKHTTLLKRINYSKWTVEKALTTPVKTPQ
jgi:hypothetical protein